MIVRLIWMRVISIYLINGKWCTIICKCIIIYISCIINAFYAIEIISFQEMYAYQTLVWLWRCVGWCDIFLSALVSIVYCSCIVQDSLYHDMDIGTTWHCALVSSTPSKSLGLVFGCTLFWCWASLCVPFTNSLIECYLLFVITNLGFLKLRNSGSATMHLQDSPDGAVPGHSLLNIGLNMLPSDSFMLCLDSLLGHSTGEFQALQLGNLVWNDSGFVNLA